MTITEIILILLGIFVFIASFVIPETKSEMEAVDRQLTKEQIQEMLKEEMKHVQEQVKDVMDELLTYSLEKSERALERLTNDKIQALSEYAGTVLEDIHKNHEETMFLYDMLNNKHENLKETAQEVALALKQANEAVSEVRQTSERAAQNALLLLQEEQEAPPVQEEQTITEEEKKVSPKQEETQPAAQETEFEPIVLSGIERIAHMQALGSMPDAVQMVPIQKQQQPQETAQPGETAQVQETAPQEKPQKAAPAQKTTPRKTVKKTVKKPRAKTQPIAAAEAAVSYDADRQDANSNEQILAMHRQGKSNVAIAKELGLGIGEVKLVIDLFKGM